MITPMMGKTERESFWTNFLRDLPMASLIKLTGQSTLILRKTLHTEIINRLFLKTPIINVLGAIVAEYVPPLVKLTERERYLLEVEYDIIYKTLGMPLKKSKFRPIVENERTYDGVLIEWTKHEDKESYRYLGPLGYVFDYSGSFSSDLSISYGVAESRNHVPSNWNYKDSKLLAVSMYNDKLVSNSTPIRTESYTRIIDEVTKLYVSTHSVCDRIERSQEEADEMFEIFTYNNPMFEE